MCLFKKQDVHRFSSLALQPTHQNCVEGTPSPAPHVASMLARPEPARFSLVARETALGVCHLHPSLSCAPSCVRCPISTQTPLKNRAPPDSLTSAWRACAPEAAISSTAFDELLTCTPCFSFDCEQSTLPQNVCKFLGCRNCQHLEGACLDMCAGNHLESVSGKSTSDGGLCLCLPLSSLRLYCSSLHLLFVTTFVFLSSASVCNSFKDDFRI